MEPFFAKKDIELFYKYLNNSQYYFEFGSGGSTYQASIRDNIKKIYSVESDIEWQKKLKNIIKKRNINYIFNQMDTKPNTWGNPGKNATGIEKINYSDQLKKLNKEEREKIDLILIDGRFRIACCLKCYDIIKNNCLIVFDDFLNRKHYHIVLNYFDIVEKSQNNIMVILKKKEGKNIPEEIIKKYELIQG